MNWQIFWQITKQITLSQHIMEGMQDVLIYVSRKCDPNQTQFFLQSELKHLIFSIYTWITFIFLDPWSL